MNTQQEFIEYILYVANRYPNVTLTKLYKLFWFANIAYAEKYGSLMIKDIFIKQKFGPVPDEGKNYIDMVRDMPGLEDDNIRLIDKRYTRYRFINIKPKRKEDADYFTDAEREILDATIAKYTKNTASELSELSHDTAWKEANLFGKVDITKDLKSKKFTEAIGEQYDDLVFIRQMKVYA